MTTINGTKISRTYRVDAGTLSVTADRKIWLRHTGGERFTHVANVGDRCFGDRRITKDNVCCAANMH